VAPDSRRLGGGWGGGGLRLAKCKTVSEEEKIEIPLRRTAWEREVTFSLNSTHPGKSCYQQRAS